MRSKRLEELPPYLFVEIDRLKQSHIRSGARVLDLGIGDPDLGAPAELLEAFHRSLENERHHRYPPDLGVPALREAIIRWAGTYHGTQLAPQEVLVTIGSKEAIGHLPLAVVDPGDVVLIPDPGYPVYHSSAVFSGADPVRFSLREEAGYWPDLASIDSDAARRAKLIFINYPNNPTSAVAGASRYEEAIEYCRDNGIILVNDAAYAEITYGKPFQPLFASARDAGIPYIELFSFSKTFSITGWRVGFVIGSPEVVAALAALKANIDSGVFGAIQEAVAVTVERHFAEITDRIRAKYRKRRDALASSLRRSGLSFSVPEATFYFWIKTPHRMGSIEFSTLLLEETGIVSTPGVGFGRYGEGYFRLSITTDDETIRAAGEQLESFSRRDFKSA
jgi:LL-diaminopimelate aminotransferase